MKENKIRWTKLGRPGSIFAFIYALMALSFILQSLCAGEAQAQKYKFQVGQTTPAETPQHKALVKFAEAVEKETKGEVKIEVTHSAALGSLLDMNDQLRTGALAMTTFVPSTKATEEKFFFVDEIPYLWKDMDQDLTACRGDLGGLYKKHAYKYGINILCFMPIGFRHMTNNKRPIYKIEDLKGLKIRVAESRPRIEAFQMLGISPTPMAFGELYTALQLGTVDGQENPVTLIYASKFYEVQKYLSLTGHILSRYTLGFSVPIWEKLPKNIQNILQKNAVEVAENENLRLAKLEEERGVQLLKEKGMVVNEVDVRPFQQALKPFYEKWIPTLGPEVKAALKKYTGSDF